MDSRNPMNAFRGSFKEPLNETSFSFIVFFEYR